jgi:hypothetical protein
MRPGQRIAATVKALAVIVLVFSALTEWVAQFHSHCSAPKVAAQALPAHQEHQSEHPPVAWTDRHGYECEHCPPSDCSGAAPCAVSAGAALVSTMVSLEAMAGRGLALPTWHDASPFSSLQPPTPPPQLLS